MACCLPAAGKKAPADDFTASLLACWLPAGVLLYFHENTVRPLLPAAAGCWLLDKAELLLACCCCCSFALLPLLST
jgi:hypothetical protein